jgi:hypothetical protein
LILARSIQTLSYPEASQYIHQYKDQDLAPMTGRCVESG